MEDLPSLRKEIDPDNTAKVFEAYWEELQTDKPSLVRAIWKTTRKEIILAGIVKLINDAAVFAGPLILQQIVRFIDSDEPLMYGIFWALGMFVSSCIGFLAYHNHLYILCVARVKIEAALISTVFKKASRITNTSLQESSIGEIVNLQSVDATNVSQVFWNLHQGWSSPLQIIIALILIAQLVELSVFGAVIVLCILVPLLLWVWNKTFVIETELMNYRDKRGTLLSEMIKELLF